MKKCLKYFEGVLASLFFVFFSLKSVICTSFSGVSTAIFDEPDAFDVYLDKISSEPEDEENEVET